MKPGPLRQVVGAVGLVALVPTAVLLAGGALDAGAAAVRALVTLAGVLVVGRLVGAWLHTAARGLEQAAAEAGDGATPGTPSGARGRRRTDAQEDGASPTTA